MNTILKLASAATLSIFSAISFSDTLTFNTDNLHGGSHSNLYSKINLNEISDVNIIAGDSVNLENGQLPNIESVELVFPYANNLIAKDFKLVNGEYIAVVDDAWIYKTVIVRLAIHGFLGEGTHFDLSVHIQETDGNIFTNEIPVTWDSIIFDSVGQLNDSRAKLLADEVIIDYEQKELTVSAFKNSVVNNQTASIELNFNWLGHGSADYYMPAPFPIDDTYSHEVVTVKILDENSENPQIELTIKDQNGFNFEIATSLRMALEESGLNGTP